VGYSLIAHGMAYVRTPDGFVAWGLAALTFVGAAFLLVGLMTPLVAVLVAVGGIGVALFDGYVAITNLIGLSIAIALLGPGAFSLDARMFGRREITIPSSSNAEPASPSTYWN
jgi:uncharacterized membrane protein YphA (DoxX/SURF4 family)